MKLLTIDQGAGNPGVLLEGGDVLNLSLMPEGLLPDGWRLKSVREISRTGGKKVLNLSEG